MESSTQINYLSEASLKGATVYAFLLIITLSFIKYGVWSDHIDRKGLQKIVGGLSVFILALIANQLPVYLVSLFIGGLIIASEEFMQKLAIVLRSKSEDIGKNLTPVKATEKEIENKKEKEAEEIQHISKDKQPSESKSTSESPNTSRIIKNYDKAEQLAMHYLQEISKEEIHTNVRIRSALTDQDIVVDGLMVNKSKHVTSIIEIKYLSIPAVIPIILERYFEKYKAHFPTLHLIFFIVTDSHIDPDIMARIKRRINRYTNTTLYIAKQGDGKLNKVINVTDEY